MGQFKKGKNQMLGLLKKQVEFDRNVAASLYFFRYKL